MDGNYKTVYPKKKEDEEEKKPRWPNERMQKRAEDFEKGFKEGPSMFERLKNWYKKDKK